MTQFCILRHAIPAKGSLAGLCSVRGIPLHTCQQIRNRPYVNDYAHTKRSVLLFHSIYSLCAILVNLQEPGGLWSVDQLHTQAQTRALQHSLTALAMSSTICEGCIAIAAFCCEEGNSCPSAVWRTTSIKSTDWLAQSLVSQPCCAPCVCEFKAERERQSPLVS